MLPLSCYVLGVLLLLAWLSKGGMGGGDIKLFALIGLVLGLIPALLALVISSLLGILYGLMLVIKTKYLKGKFIPFGPFIALGAMIAYLLGRTDVTLGVFMARCISHRLILARNLNE